MVMPQVLMEVQQQILGLLDTESSLNAAFSCRTWLQLLMPHLPELKHLNISLDFGSCDGHISYRIKHYMWAAVCQCLAYARAQCALIRELLELNESLFLRMLAPLLPAIKHLTAASSAEDEANPAERPFPLAMDLRGTGFDSIELGKNLHSPLFRGNPNNWMIQPICVNIGFDRKALLLAEKEKLGGFAIIECKAERMDLLTAKSTAKIEGKITDLRYTEVRWFFKRKRENEKNWTALKGYDSTMLELAHRRKHGISLDDAAKQQMSALPENVIVLDGNYQADEALENVDAIYWKEDSFQIRRCIWFYSETMRPLQADFADAIEEQHLETFGGDVNPETPVFSDTESSRKPELTIMEMEWGDEKVCWNSVVDVYIAARKTKDNFLFVSNRAKPTPLRRGYSEADPNEGKPDFSDLILVVHGIGHKGKPNLIAENTAEIRDAVKMQMKRFYPNEKRRPAILPIEWRSSLLLDNGMTDTVTLPKMEHVRNMLNSVCMDLMYYQSPVYRSEIVNSVIKCLNSVYKMFTENTGFSGPISIVGHSLGSVIVYDILTNWSPFLLYDEFVTNAIVENMRNSTSQLQKLLLEQFYNSRKQLLGEGNQMEQILIRKEEPLKFKVKNLFCLGSPLAVFIIMRGAGYKSVVPSSDQVERVFNIFHPYDPVAYRLEPMFHENYRHINIIDAELTMAPIDHINFFSLLYAHSSYWKDLGIALFILKTIYAEEDSDPSASSSTSEEEEADGNKELKWGIMGCGMISNDFAHAMLRKCQNPNKIHAVASATSLERAQKFVDKLQVPGKDAIKAYGSYDELLADPEIEIIYIGILNQTHCRWVYASLEQGKHVLCEKPMGLSLAEAEMIARKAREKGLFVMEGFSSRFFPVWQKIRSIVDSKKFGAVKAIEANFGTILPANRFDPSISECPAIDIGIYTVMFAMFCMGDQAPSHVRAHAIKNADGVDICGKISLEFGGGAARANLTHSTGAASSAFVSFERGTVQIPDWFYSPTRMRITKGTPFGKQIDTREFPLEDDSSVYNFPNSSGLRYEADHVFECIRSGLKESPVASLETSLRVTAVMEDIRHQIGIRFPAQDDAPNKCCL